MRASYLGAMVTALALLVGCRSLSTAEEPPTSGKATMEPDEAIAALPTGAGDEDPSEHSQAEGSRQDAPPDAIFHRPGAAGCSSGLDYAGPVSTGDPVSIGGSPSTGGAGAPFGRGASSTRIVTIDAVQESW